MEHGEPNTHRVRVHEEMIRQSTLPSGMLSSPKPPTQGEGTANSTMKDKDNFKENIHTGGTVLPGTQNARPKHKSPERTKSSGSHHYQEYTSCDNENINGKSASGSNEDDDDLIGPANGLRINLEREPEKPLYGRHVGKLKVHQPSQSIAGLNNQLKKDRRGPAVDTNEEASAPNNIVVRKPNRSDVSSMNSSKTARRTNIKGKRKFNYPPVERKGNMATANVNYSTTNERGDEIPWTTNVDGSFDNGGWYWRAGRYSDTMTDYEML